MFIFSARECYDLLKGTYGIGNCYFLAVNSLDATSNLDAGVPEPWSACLRITDNQVCITYTNVHVHVLIFTSHTPFATE